jgi:hypothetical protein
VAPRWQSVRDFTGCGHEFQGDLVHVQLLVIELSHGRIGVREWDNLESVRPALVAYSTHRNPPVWFVPVPLPEPVPDS